MMGFILGWKQEESGIFFDRSLSIHLPKIDFHPIFASRLKGLTVKKLAVIG
jgi:hypothetical protein